MSSYFLAASTEIQLIIINYITHPTDLKALCLVSKEVSAFAIPALYHQVDLTPREPVKTPHFMDEVYDLNRIKLEQLGRLQSLLSNKENLLFIRILITTECGRRMTSMLNELLGNLRENQLLEFHYGERGIQPNNYMLERCYEPKNRFPNLEQMALVWASQQRLQALHSAHIFMLFEEVKRNRLEASAILRPVKELIIIWEHIGLHMSDSISWLINNVDVSALRRLKLVGVVWHLEEELQRLEDLFAGNAFVNLTELFLKDVVFSTPLQLADCPALQSLSILYCQPNPDGAVTLLIPHPLQIKFLHFATARNLNQVQLLAQIIRQIQGLTTFVLEMASPHRDNSYYFLRDHQYCFSREIIDEFRTEMAFALEMQQDTLIELVVREERYSFSLVFAGEGLFRVIQGCEKLRRLALPLGLKEPIPCYSQLMRDLPHLAYYWLMEPREYITCDDAYAAAQFKNAIPTESNLRFFAYNWYCYSRQERKDYEPTARPGPAADTVVGSAFTRIIWKKANPMFYNRYPCYPLLPNELGTPSMKRLIDE